MSAAPLRYLSASDVRAAMPDVEERIALARLVALTGNRALWPIGLSSRWSRTQSCRQSWVSILAKLTR